MKGGNKQIKLCFGILLIGTIPCTWLFVSRNQPRTRNSLCSSAQPVLPMHAGERTILSLNFSGLEKYLDNLFSTCSSASVPEFPAFLTALSSNHFEEGRTMLYNFNQTVRRRYPNSRLFVFDIGLSKEEALEIRSLLKCNYQVFPFDNFPSHVKLLKGFAWKPLAMQLVIKEHPFVVWMDASIRFTTSNVDRIINKAKTEGVLARRVENVLLMHTAKPTFEVLKTDPWLYNGKAMFGAAFVVIRATPYVVQYIVRPWISCALKLGCMVPVERADELRHCKRSGALYFRCHRFDQSVLSILIHMVYREKALSHAVCDQEKDHFIVCRGCKGEDSGNYIKYNHLQNF